MSWQDEYTKEWSEDERALIGPLEELISDSISDMDVCCNGVDVRLLSLRLIDFGIIRPFELTEISVRVLPEGGDET